MRQYSHHYNARWDRNDEAKAAKEELAEIIKDLKVLSISYPNEEIKDDSKKIDIDVVIEMKVDQGREEEFLNYVSNLNVEDDNRVRIEERCRLEFTEEDGWKIEILGPTGLYEK